MKFITLLLSVYVTLLAVIPCCSNDNCAGDDAVKTEQHNQSDTENKDLGNCSPFYSCSSCAGFTFQNNYFKLTAIAAPLKEEIIRNCEKFNSFYSADIWQPPKVG